MKPEGNVITDIRRTAAYIARLTGTATVAYLTALLIPAGTSRPVLAARR